MISLIVMLIIGLGVAYFAIQNTGGVTIQLDQAVWRDIPLYVIVIVSLLVGMLFSGLLNFIKSLSSRWTLRGKDHEIKDAKKTIADLTKRIHQLELENTKLKAGSDETTSEDNSL